MLNLKSVLRSLRRERAFTAAVVVTLGLGLGGCLAIFAVVRAVMLRPLPFPSPDRLAIVWMTNPEQGFDRDIISYPQFRDWRDQSRDVFEAVAVHTAQFASLSGAGPAQEIRLAQVSEEFFPAIGAVPVLGRALAAGDFVVGQHQVAVIAHALWMARFGGDPGLVGRSITVNGEPMTVVGVLPPAVAFPLDAEAWAPLAAVPAMRATFEARGALWLSVIARLRPGVPVVTAQRAMEVIQARFNQAYPQATPGTGVLVSPLHQDLVGTASRSLWLLQGAVLGVLLIACANVSNLLLARATARHREIATRVALGAGWGRIARECLTESAMLSAAGAALGLGLALWLMRLLPTFAPAQVPLLGRVSLDAGVMAAAVALAVVTAVVVGSAPIARFRRVNLSTAIRDGGRQAGESGGGRVRMAIVATQLALALVLLVGAGLLIKSFANVLGIETGFTTEPVLTARFALPAERHPGERRVAIWDELTRRVGELPGVKAAGGVTTVLLGRLPNSAPMTPEGRPDLPQSLLSLPVAIDSATPGYFEAVGQRLVAGRGFTGFDRADSLPVALVNESLARTYFAGMDAIGRRVTFGDPGNPKTTWLTIVGVVSDAGRASAGPELEVRPEVYMPYPQRRSPGMMLVVRASGEAMSLVAPIQEITRSIDPDVPLARLRTLDELLGARLAERRFVMGLLAAFAGLAVLLSAIGIYGVIAYTVTRRLPEFAMRLALGAGRGEVAKLVFRQGLIVAAIGTAAGAVGTVAVTRFAGPQLYQVSPTDPWVFALVVALLLAVAAIASWLPARRASSVDPMVVLRRE
jgi:putative ABC transport system permease protein